MYTFFRGLAMWRRAKGDERGATAVEYGLIVALIAAVIVAIVGFLGDEILAAFTEVRDAIRDRGL
ncbi:Flp family type IVb pilin [Actinomycetota bacterium]